MLPECLRKWSITLCFYLGIKKNYGCALVLKQLKIHYKQLIAFPKITTISEGCKQNTTFPIANTKNIQDTIISNKQHCHFESIQYTYILESFGLMIRLTAANFRPFLAFPWRWKLLFLSFNITFPKVDSAQVND